MQDSNGYLFCNFFLVEKVIFSFSFVIPTLLCFQVDVFCYNPFSACVFFYLRECNLTLFCLQGIVCYSGYLVDYFILIFNHLRTSDSFLSEKILLSGVIKNVNPLLINCLIIILPTAQNPLIFSYHHSW